MKNIFRLKYKIHKLVNILFYLIFFAVGFYTARIFNNLSLKEIIQQILGG